MDFDFTPFFEKYEALVQKADAAFKTIQSQHPACVTCYVGCSDCCYALFDLSLVEALYINTQFHERFSGQRKWELLETANRVDRKTYQIKRQAYKYQQAGKDDVEILSQIGAERVRCALLNEDDRCIMYDARPITCRLYGLPLNIQGMTHTCGKTGFQEGKAYPTVYLDKIQQQLHDISMGLAEALQSRYNRIGEVLVPLSMALITTYDEAYLGIGTDTETKGPEEAWKTSKKKKKHGKKPSSILCRLDDNSTS